MGYKSIHDIRHTTYAAKLTQNSTHQAAPSSSGTYGANSLDPTQGSPSSRNLVMETSHRRNKANPTQTAKLFETNAKGKAMKVEAEVEAEAQPQAQAQAEAHPAGDIKHGGPVEILRFLLFITYFFSSTFSYVQFYLFLSTEIIADPPYRAQNMPHAIPRRPSILVQ